MLLAISLGILLGILVVYILLAPIILSIDTYKNDYSIQLKGLAKASIEPHKDELLKVKIRVLFFKFYFNPIDAYFKHQKNKALKPKKKTNRKSSRQLNFKKGLQVLKTCKIKRFVMNLDTGNVITNAKLYPIFSFLNYYVGGFNINFQGQNYLSVRLQNRPIHILKTLLNP